MGRYLWTFVGLLALTGLTLGLSFVHLGPLGVPVALTIAAVKAALVGLFFMHLVEASTSSRLALAVGVALLATLLALSALDVATRPAPPGRETPAAAGRSR